MAYNMSSAMDVHKYYGGSGSKADRAVTFQALGLGNASDYVGSSDQNGKLVAAMKQYGGLTMPASASPAPASAATSAGSAPPAAAAAPAQTAAQPSLPTFKAPEADPRVDEAIKQLEDQTYTPSAGLEQLKADIDGKLEALQNRDSQFAERINESLDRILNPEKFEYDYSKDPNYIAMRDEYIRNGRLAMLDTGAAAAAANGGRETSYGRAAAQQAYQNYAAALSGKISELEETAYARYRDSLADEKDRYTILAGERDRERANAESDLNLAIDLWRYATDDELKQYGLKRDELRDMIDVLTERENTEYDRALDDYNRQFAEIEYSDKRTENEYDKLVSLIAAGYSPTDNDLKKAGMSKSRADALRAAYQLEVSSASKNNSSGSGSSSKAKTFDASKALTLWNNESKGYDLDTDSGRIDAITAFVSDYPDDIQNSPEFEAWMKGRKMGGHTYYDWYYYAIAGNFPDGSKLKTNTTSNTTPVTGRVKPTTRKQGGAMEY